MLPDWFNLVLEARVQRELMWLFVDWENNDCGKYRQESANLAWKAGYLMPDMSTPSLLDFDDELVESFKSGQSQWHQEKYDVAKAEKGVQRIAEIEGFIATKNWDALSLPSPEELLAGLSAGESHEVGGHSLNPDEDGVWVVNSYGHDCALWQNITLESIEEFLTDMARGEEYGPVPH